jgi:predicted acyl esterase
MRLASLLAVLSLAIAARSASAAPSFRLVTIDAMDGVPLAASVLEPDTPGPHPAVVLPASWGQHHLEYLVQGLALAARGYVVVAYTARGFLDSGGAIDVAGPSDVADLSATIDWMLANTDADPARIGAAGISYSAGIALLGAAFDDRIRAVVSLSGWSDLVYSLYSNQTRRRQSLEFLLLLSGLTGRASPEMTTVLGDFEAGQNYPDLIAFGRIRGAGTYLDEINQHRPAILLTSAWGETIFPVNQLVDFFEGLEGPRRWELRPGDHGTNEIIGILGVPTDAWTSLGRWFDHHLAGVDNGIDREPAIVATPRTSKEAETYPAWSALATRHERLFLGDGDALGATAGTAARTVRGDTIAAAGICLVTGALETAFGVPPTLWLPAVSRASGAVWVSAPLDAPRPIRGAPHLRLTLTPDRDGDTTAIAYLYDIDRWGVGRLITHLPITARGATAGAAIAVDHDFFLTSHDVPAGHRIALVIDSADPLYLDAAPAGSTLTITPPAGGARVDLPLR